MALTLPVMLRRVASGLMIEKVRVMATGETPIVWNIGGMNVPIP
jgi:hypothetical protein